MSPHAPSAQPRFALSRGEFVAMMALMMALQALAIDSMLPALPAIAGDLSVGDPNDRQLVVGVYLLTPFPPENANVLEKVTYLK